MGFLMGFEQSLSSSSSLRAKQSIAPQKERIPEFLFLRIDLATSGRSKQMAETGRQPRAAFADIPAKPAITSLEKPVSLR
jgi:hypothetical protein